MVNGSDSPRSNNDPLTFPSQVSQPSWMEEAMMNLNKHIVTSINDESINMPSQPTVMNDEIVHFYVDGGSLEKPNKDNEEPSEEDKVVKASLLVDPQPLPRNTPTEPIPKVSNGESVNARKERNTIHSLIGPKFTTNHLRILHHIIG